MLVNLFAHLPVLQHALNGAGCTQRLVADVLQADACTLQVLTGSQPAADGLFERPLGPISVQSIHLGLHRKQQLDVGGCHDGGQP